MGYAQVSSPGSLICLFVCLFCFALFCFHRLTPNGKKIPLRMFMSNQSGYYLDFHIYREVEDPRTNQVDLEWSDLRNAQTVTQKVQVRPPSGLSFVC